MREAKQQPGRDGVAFRHVKRRSALLVALALVWGEPAVAADPREKLVMLPLSAEESLKQQAAAASELLLTELGKDGRYEVLGTSELQTLLGVERQKQLLGCNDEANSCMTELSGALGAPYVLSGALTRTAEGLRIDLKVIQTEKATVLARAGGLAASEAELLGTAGRVLNDLLMALPGAKTSAAQKRLPWVTGTLGSLAALVGLVLFADEAVQTNRLQGQLTAHAVTAPAASTWIGGIYRERAAAVLLVTVGSLIGVASLVWWWLS
jgi:TolB-like protein